VIADIDAYVQNSTVYDEAAVYNLAQARFKYNGKLTGQGAFYGLPMNMSPTVIYYNKALLAKAGITEGAGAGQLNNQIPMTWEELRALAEVLTVRDRNQIITQYGFYTNNWFTFAWSNGGDVVSADRKTFTFDSQECREALEFFVGLSAGGGAAPQVSPKPNITADLSSDSMFDSQKTAMVLNGRWATATYRLTCSFDWDVMPLPVSPRTVERLIKEEGMGETEARRAAQAGHSGGVAICVAENSDKKDAAFRFAEFLAGPAGQEKYASGGLNVPNQRALANSEAFLQSGQKPANSAIFAEAAEFQQPGDWNYYPDRAWIDSWANVFNSKVLGGELSLEAFYADQKPKVQAILNNYAQRFGL
jgi:multiple sugar transport system substrate-binding protein